VIEGTVTDSSSSSPVSNAHVAVRSPAGGAATTTLTDHAGRYRVEVAAGTYTVTVSYTLRSNPNVTTPTLDRSSSSHRVQVAGGASARADFQVTLDIPDPAHDWRDRRNREDRGPCCKPYGAPPARRRLV
jgi:hypothetical protein